MNAQIRTHTSSRPTVPDSSVAATEPVKRSDSVQAWRRSGTIGGDLYMAWCIVEEERLWQARGGR